MLCTRPGLSVPPKRESDELAVAAAALVESKRDTHERKKKGLLSFISTSMYYIHAHE